MKSINVSGIPVSTVTLGSGGRADGDTLLRLLDKYYELGGRTVDTARKYDQLGESSERVIGCWLRSRGVRKDITLVTKGGFPRERMVTSLIREDMERSLDELGCTPDIYFLHRDMPDTPVGEFVGLCNEFIAEGFTEVWGVSNWDNDRISAACKWAADNGAIAPAVSQIQWSLAVSSGKRSGDESLICMNEARFSDYERSGMPVMAFSPQAKGFFSKFASGVPFSPKVIERFVDNGNLARAERVKKLSDELGVSAAAVTLSYIVNAGLNAAAVVGCLNETHLADSMTACSLRLTREQCDYLYGGFDELL